MAINNIGAKITQQQQMLKTAAKGGQNTAAANSGTTAKQAKDNKPAGPQDGIDSKTLERAKEQANLKEVVQDGMEANSDENLKTNKQRSKDEDTEVRENQIGDQYGQAELRAVAASDSEEEEYIEVSDSQAQALDQKDSPAFAKKLNADIPQNIREQAEAQVEKEINKVGGEENMELKGDNKVDGVSAEMSLGLTESIQAALNVPAPIADPISDKKYGGPMIQEDQDAEALAKQEAAKQLASGDLAQEELISQ